MRVVSKPRDIACVKDQVLVTPFSDGQHLQSIWADAIDRGGKLDSLAYEACTGDPASVRCSSDVLGLY